MRKLIAIITIILTIFCTVPQVQAKGSFLNPNVNITEVRASHILVKNRKDAVAIKKDIESGKITFEEAAMQYSLCPSGAYGGDLGYFGRGMMVKPFEDACFSMNVGDLSEPIETQFGWHLIQLTDIQE